MARKSNSDLSKKVRRVSLVVRKGWITYPSFTGKIQLPTVRQMQCSFNLSTKAVLEIDSEVKLSDKELRSIMSELGIDDEMEEMLEIVTPKDRLTNILFAAGWPSLDGSVLGSGVAFFIWATGDNKYAKDSVVLLEKKWSPNSYERITKEIDSRNSLKGEELKQIQNKEEKSSAVYFIMIVIFAIFISILIISKELFKK